MAARQTDPENRPSLNATYTHEMGRGGGGGTLHKNVSVVLDLNPNLIQ